jgi:hypothetical protein
VSSPAEWDETERLQRELGDDAAPALANRRRPALARPGIGWDNFGFVPRWIVDEATSCVAALNPDQFDGMTQYRRFVEAAKRHGETALAVAIVEAPRGHGSGSGFNFSMLMVFAAPRFRWSGTRDPSTRPCSVPGAKPTLPCDWTRTTKTWPCASVTKPTGSPGLP